ncbi:chemotaxis protein CheX [Halobacillus salinarum]|uniref:Chemotaxis protein CheX n=1 Tax=Halobacillus salinarum TaxID=2932257 RepID=A0ABY4EF57_9BACI|nr:chemotaxis protein CheX [Halobacillus salinarum]UOQ42754.1 chemotaxis protein CheX [Halobacillus salinarum]
MSVKNAVAEVLNGSLESVSQIFPFDLIVERPESNLSSIQIKELGVMIGMSGDLHASLIIEGNESSFGLIGERMFGMPLEGEMLNSFTKELANMVAGHLSTRVSKSDLALQITTPQVMDTYSVNSRHHYSFKIPVQFQDDHKLTLFLIVDKGS